MMRNETSTQPGSITTGRARGPSRAVPLLAAAHLAIATLSAYAGGSPLRTVVVVNRNSDASMELGRYYAEARGLPDHHIIPIRTAVSNDLDLAAYSNQIEGPVRAYLADTGLSNHIDTVVFTIDTPYRVYEAPFTNRRWAALSSSYYYSFFSSPNAFVSGCNLAANSSNRYFGAEQAFHRETTFASNQVTIAALLTSSNLSAALRLTDRSVAADGTLPQAAIRLLRTTDNFRNVQWPMFEDVLFRGAFSGQPSDRARLDANSLTGLTNLFGVTAGATVHPWITNNTVLPGAFAEHLTSFGGALFDTKAQPQDPGQMSILDWIFFGFSGSYGTVVEPCAFTAKFVNPRFHDHYARGFNLGESLYQSVQNPYQGIFVGDPLCAPFAQPPDVTWAGVTNGSIWSGLITVTGLVTAADATRPVQHIDAWRNGHPERSVTQWMPVVGNTITVQVQAVERGYTVTEGDDLPAIAQGLAAALNAPPALPVTARAFGDRLEIIQNAIGEPASNWLFSVTSAAGTAATLAVSAHLPHPTFIESFLPAREGLTLSGSSQSGDVIRAIITRTDGAVFTNEVVAVTSNMAVNTLMQSLENAINANTNLQTATGCHATYRRMIGATAELWLFARTNTWEGATLSVDYSVLRAATNSTLSGPDFFDTFNDNAEVLGARATAFFAVGVTQWTDTLTFDTTTWPDGPHTLTLAARDGSGVGTEGRASVTFTVDNHDLACTITAPNPGAYRFKQGMLTVEVAAVATTGTVTNLLLFAEGKPVATGTTATLTTTLDLADHGAGTLRLQARAEDSLGQATLSTVIPVILYTDADGDGLSDQWEYRHFASPTNQNGTADSDGDGATHYEEFIAGTQPTNAADVLAITSLDDDLRLTFPAKPDRAYRVRLHEGDLRDPSGWLPASPLLTGPDGPLTWPDHPTNAPPATNTIRFLAIEPRLPE